MLFPAVITISITGLGARRSAIRVLTRIGCNIIADNANRNDLHIYCYTVEQIDLALAYLKQ